jgi:hypothetical protein
MTNSSCPIAAAAATTALVSAGEGPLAGNVTGPHVEEVGENSIAVLLFSRSLFEFMPQIHRRWLRFCEI